MKILITLCLALAFVAPMAAGTAVGHLAPVEQWLTQWTKTYGQCPQGTLNIIVDGYKVMHDNVPSKDWYYYHWRLQSVPGNVPSGCNSGWLFSIHRFHHDVCCEGAKLNDYGPTTTNSEYSPAGTATVNVGTEPSVSYRFTDVYNIPYVKVIDWSDYSAHSGRGHFVLNHDCAEQNNLPKGNPCDSTFQVKPTSNVLTNACTWSLTDNWFIIEFGYHFWWGWGYNQFGNEGGYALWFDLLHCSDEV